MDKFLATAKTRLGSLVANRVLAVLGNEACDLDSAVSSVVYSYFLEMTQVYPGRIIVPVFNIPRNALRLRTEVVHAFKKENIFLESLICKDEIDLKALYNKELLELILVDQNVLRDLDKCLESAAIEIIDHHKQEYEPREKLRKVILEPVGSCCTLVAERILHSMPELLSPQVSVLLYSAILIDTSNLSSVTKRATAKDIEVVEKLEKILVGIDRRTVYQDVQTAKDSVEGFMISDLLEKDQKVLSISHTVVALSTLVTTLQDFVNRMLEPNEIKNYCSEKGINVLVLLNSIIIKDTFLRELAVYSSSDDARTEVCKILVESQNPNLMLKEKTLERAPGGLTAFSQENVIYTRKAVLPLIKESMSTQVQEFDKMFSKP